MDELLLSKNVGAESPRRPSTKKAFTHDFAPSLHQYGAPHITKEVKTPSDDLKNLIANLGLKGKITYRSRSAPSVLVTGNGEDFHDPFEPKTAQMPPTLIVRLSFIGVFLYVAIGVAVYLTSESFKGTATFKPVDAVYFTVVTLCSIGYGDVVPDTTFTKIFTCGFILVGFGYLSFVLSRLVEYICDTQEEALLSMMDENQCKKMLRTYMIDKEKGTMRIKTKVCLALAVVIGCIAIGTASVHFLEDLNWVDSFYLSIASVSTVGYGDYAFKTVTGRCFAIIWLLVSTLAVGRAFLYLTDYSMDKRTHRTAKWVLQKKITLSDLVAADLDKDGSISKSEFVIYKLKQMGKVDEKDILKLSKQFDSLDSVKFGKITLASLMETV